MCPLISFVCAERRDFVSYDCRLHRKVAHQSILEWTLAMAPLRLPPYVLEHVFGCLDFNYTPRQGVYSRRIPTKRIALVECAAAADFVENYVHLIIEERSHLENIKMFIAVHRAYQRTIG